MAGRASRGGSVMARRVLLVDLHEPSACSWIQSDLPDALCTGQSTLMVLEADDNGQSLMDTVDELTDAVVTGLADYCRKSGITSVVLGLSGGIDSAVAACVAVAALGPQNVTGLAMPSRLLSTFHRRCPAHRRCAGHGIHGSSHRWHARAR